MGNLRVLRALGFGALALVFCGRLEAAGVEWRKDVRVAVKEAERTQKPLLMKITASWCGFCKKMEKTTFADKQLAAHVNDCFVPVLVDADSNRKLVDAIGVDGLPTTVIVSPKLEVVRKITGYKTAEQLRPQLAAICPVKHEEPASRLVEKPAAPKPNEPISRRPLPDRPSLPDRRPLPTASVAAVSQTKTLAAFDGVCLVSLLDDRKIRDGSTQFATMYRGKSVRFASADHLKRFVTNPQAYWPQNDGNCPVTSAERRTPSVGRPESAAVFRGHLWFFTDKSQRTKFADAPETYLR